ncbi:uncharacterized protein LOC102807677 [Saccoglossus kowalevskii]|uniref:Cysteine and tyrosine-rich protein 1-like n=1 Tax=Saccoglossus kowalevskii TaxID=10224 RepID=A0ABM0LYE2_SACKO|nr:PREDICTED: cysteine and tyrosine-rich protein 1-like [Saccoglossus kowalevskii]
METLGLLLSLTFCCLALTVTEVKSDYCYGYYDSDGNYTEGFYCPKTVNSSSEAGYNSSSKTYCCQSSTDKYCCDYDDWLSDGVSDVVICGTSVDYIGIGIVVVVVAVLITIGAIAGIIACVCCCIKKRSNNSTRAHVIHTQPYLQPQGALWTAESPPVYGVQPTFTEPPPPPYDTLYGK